MKPPKVPLRRLVRRLHDARARGLSRQEALDEIRQDFDRPELEELLELLDEPWPSAGEASGESALPETLEVEVEIDDDLDDSEPGWEDPASSMHPTGRGRHRRRHRRGRGPGREPEEGPPSGFFGQLREQIEDQVAEVLAGVEDLRELVPRRHRVRRKVRRFRRGMHPFPPGPPPPPPPPPPHPGHPPHPPGETAQPPAASSNAASGTRRVSTSETFQTWLRRARSARASRIHLDPNPEGGRVSFRRDGVVSVQEALDPIAYGEVFESFLQALGVDWKDSEPLTNHRALFRIEEGGEELRLEIDAGLVRCAHGLGGSFSLLAYPRERSQASFEEVVHSEADRRRIRAFLKEPSGLVLATGPTGSGKTTFSYMLLEELAAQGKRVVTVEDPPGMTFPDWIQLTPPYQGRVGMVPMIRQALRMDPDVLFLGELRDPESAQLALQASLVGIKVVVCMHAGTTLGALQRLLDIGLEGGLLAEALNGVVSMRLVRRLDPEAKDSVQYRGRRQMHAIRDVDAELRAGLRSGDLSSRKAEFELAEFRGPRDQALAEGWTTEEELLRVFGAFPEAPSD